MSRFGNDQSFDDITLTLFLHYRDSRCQIAVLGPGLAWLRAGRGGDYVTVDGHALRGVLSSVCELIAEYEGLMGPTPEDPRDLEAHDAQLERGIYAAMTHLLNVTPDGDSLLESWDDAAAATWGVKSFTRPGTPYYEWGKLGDWRLTSRLQLL